MIYLTQATDLKVPFPERTTSMANKTEQIDASIIGAGHNGLVAAGYLARAGKKVVVLEQRDRAGGACTLEEPFPGFTMWCHQLPKIVDNSRQLRSRRPGSVRRASVPTAFRHVISPGVAREVSRVGTSPLGPAIAPPLSHVCSFADGPGLPVFAGVSLWQASPPRPVAGEGAYVTSAAWCGLRR
jgi:NAD(P)-binding Rossmann-like domain